MSDVVSKIKLRVIGDTHGEIYKVTHNTKGQKADIYDYIVVLGDFGFIGKTLNKLIKYLNQTNQKLLFVEGNHENYKKLNKIKEIDMFGGKVGIYAQNIYWLKRGEAYNINNRNILTFGGAYSVDRIYRTEGISWFSEEEYNDEEFHKLTKNIEKYNNKFDYIFSHDCPRHITLLIHGHMLKESRTSYLLENIYKTCEFESWFFGHHHVDIKIDDKFIGLWEKDVILEI